MPAAVIAARWRAGLLALALLGLSGCASVQVAEWGRDLPAASRVERVELSSVPFFPQEEYQCGPAALATVLQSAGIDRTPEQLVEQVYLPQRQGSLQVELLGASRRAGAVPYVLRSQPDELLREVAAGNPVVVLQNVGWLTPQWHYAVVVGYDLADKTLTLRSGPEKRMVMPIEEFDRTWAKGERWAFVALPPDRLPATANEADWVASVATFARVSPALAPTAYRTALDRWPQNLFARLALGNSAYRQRQHAEAASHYRRATVDHPESADAWNNLAQVLFEQGERAEAAQAARRAVAIGGPRGATYARTLSAIEAGGARVQ